MAGSIAINNELHAYLWDLRTPSITQIDLTTYQPPTQDIIVRVEIAWSVNDLPEPEVVGEALGKWGCFCSQTQFQGDVRLGFRLRLQAGQQVLHLPPYQFSPDCDSNSVGYDVNSARNRVGHSIEGGPLCQQDPGNCDGTTDAMHWTATVPPSGPTALEDYDPSSPPTGLGSSARCINDGERIVGWGREPDTPGGAPDCLKWAFLWRSPAIMEFCVLPMPPTMSPEDERQADAIANSDANGVTRVVGWNITQPLALLWESAAPDNNCPSWVPKDLDMISCAAWTVEQARDVHTNGQIAGYGRIGGSPLLHAIVLIPVPNCCIEDIDEFPGVGITDLLALLAAWGACVPPFCPSSTCLADLDCDGSVGVTDLLRLLAAWGPSCGLASGGPPQNIQDCFDRFGYEDPLVLQHCICAVEPCAEGCPPGGCQ